MTVRMLYPVDEALEQVPIGRTKFYEEVEEGRITLTKIGRRSFVTHEELERYVASKSNPDAVVVK